ncbi:MAG: carboxylating nicotinate-nucleotide diphosphorylase [Wenzhouxiangellaceae bacterium]
MTSDADASNSADSALELPPVHTIAAQVAAALAEDLGLGDVSAQLIAPQQQLSCQIISRENGILCGCAWADETLRQVDPALSIIWHCQDGAAVSPEQLIAELQGPARSLLSAERTVLNFLQCLSGTATAARRYVDLVADTGVRLLDTRKTIPGLRLAQKYAARCGGFSNHRMGLYDQYLIKENHIHAAGSIRAAVQQAQRHQADLLIEVEVETLQELAEAADAGAHRALLDNFSLSDLRQAVGDWGERIELEASGGITRETLHQVAAAGVHYISVGAVTKNLRALDLSMRFVE